MTDDRNDGTGRRRFLRRLGAIAAGAALAPTAARTLRVEAAPAHDDRDDEIVGEDRARRGMRWIGHC